MVELTPKQRQKIYEEEKAKIEARVKMEAEKEKRKREYKVIPLNELTKKGRERHPEKLKGQLSSADDSKEPVASYPDTLVCDMISIGSKAVEGGLYRITLIAHERSGEPVMMEIQKDATFLDDLIVWLKRLKKARYQYIKGRALS